MHGLLKLANDDDAFQELLRRHVLPVVEGSNGNMASYFKGGDSMMDQLLSQVATTGRIPPESHRELRKLKLKYNNVPDQQLLSKARGSTDERTLQIVREIMEAEDGQ